MDLELGIIHHYTCGDLKEIVLNWLTALGKNPYQPGTDDLAPIDELHSGGREATVAFAAAVELQRDQHLLDVGCGIGGPARFLRN